MSKKIEKENKEQYFCSEIDIGIGIVMERFGQANAEHFKSFSELKRISNYKISDEFADNNYKQQAGFSAEVKQKVRVNAENILNKSSIRIDRTDNVGDVNHKIYDHILTDLNGNPLKDESGNYIKGSQQKTFFKVKNYDKLLSKEFEHYKDTEIYVPSNQFKQINKRWAEKIDKLERQENELLNKGNTEQANIIRKQINQIEDVKKRLRRSKVSTKEAIKARKKPFVSTVKDIARISHKAGLKAAEMSAYIGFGLNGIQNAIAIIKGDKEFKEASFETMKNTAEISAKSYTTAFTASVVGGTLESSSKQVLKNLAKKNTPTVIVNTSAILCKNTYRLVNGEMTIEQFANKISEEGTNLASSMVGSNLGAVIGTAIIPGVGTIIGGVIGGMVASMMSGALYIELIKTINDSKISNEKRTYIQEYCRQLKEDERKHRADIVEIYSYFFAEKEKELRLGFNKLAESIYFGKSMYSGLETIAGAFNIQLLFNSTEDFKEHINQGKVFKL